MCRPEWLKGCIPVMQPQHYEAPKGIGRSCCFWKVLLSQATFKQRCSKNHTVIASQARICWPATHSADHLFVLDRADVWDIHIARTGAFSIFSHCNCFISGEKKKKPEALPCSPFFHYTCLFWYAKSVSQFSALLLGTFWKSQINPLILYKAVFHNPIQLA